MKPNLVRLGSEFIPDRLKLPVGHNRVLADSVEAVAKDVLLFQ